MPKVRSACPYFHIMKDMLPVSLEPSAFRLQETYTVANPGGGLEMLKV